MKGVTIERAKPSNILDYYALLKEASKNKELYPSVTEEQIRDDYFNLPYELSADERVVYLARKGRAYLGYCTGTLVKRRVQNRYHIEIDGLFVTQKKRKLGIGRDLFRKMIHDFSKLGITQFEFLCKDEMIPYFEKQGAIKVMTRMVVTHG